MVRVEKGLACRWGGIAAVLWLAWPKAKATAVTEAGYYVQEVKEYWHWLGLRAQRIGRGWNTRGHAVG